MSKRSRKKKKTPADDQQRQLLDQLKEVAVGIGVDVREEKLHREVGYAVRSGPCRVGDRDVVLLDSNSTPADRIEVMLEFLAGRELEGVYLEPELRERIEAHRPEDDGDESACA